MKIHITTTTPIGEKCHIWAMENLPEGVELVDNMNDCEILFSVFYGELFTEKFLKGRKRVFNFHGGILPEYAGSATFNWAIINGEKETGITLHEIDARVDHGKIITIETFPIEKQDTAVEVYKKLEETIFILFTEWFDRLASLDYEAHEQDHSKRKMYTRKAFQKAKDLTPYVRAYHFPPYEEAFYYNKKGEKVYLKWE